MWSINIMSCCRRNFGSGCVGIHISSWDSSRNSRRVVVHFSSANCGHDVNGGANMECPMPATCWSHDNLICMKSPSRRPVLMCFSSDDDFAVPCAVNKWCSPFPPHDVGPNMISSCVRRLSPSDVMIE